MILGAALVCLATINPHLQARPDFSGAWTFDRAKSMAPGPDGRIVLAPILGDTFEASQDDTRLTLAIKAGALNVTAVYNFQGESRNQSPGGPGQPDVVVRSHVLWEGDALAFLSSSTSVVNGREVPVETRRVLRLDASGDLIIERTGTPASEVTPSRSVYRRVPAREPRGAVDGRAGVRHSTGAPSTRTIAAASAPAIR